MENCFYCQLLASKDLEFEDDNFFFYKKKSDNDVIVGELIAKIHVKNSIDSISGIHLITGELFKRSIEIMKNETNNQDISLSCNLGDHAGQTDHHLKFKFIPRFKDEYFSNIGIESWVLSLDNSRQNNKKDREFLDNLEDFFS